LERSATLGELKADRFSIGDHAVDAARETVTVDLEAMSKSRLGDAFAAIDLRNQSIEIWMEVLIDERDEVRDYRGKEYTTEPRSRFNGQDQAAERESPRRSDWPRVPDFDFGEDVRRRRRQGRLRSNRCTIR
jgi:hypothetical protein